MFTYWTNVTFDETRYWSLAINLNDPSDTKVVNEISEAFIAQLQDINVEVNT